MFHSRISVSYVSSFIILILVFCNFSAQAAPKNRTKNNNTCGIVPGKPLTNAYGPFDYTNPKDADYLPRVIGAHFTSDVERLIDGSSGAITHDLDYTLRAIPNFHRALFVVSKYERINGPMKHYYTAECYFKRAIYFQPQDAVSRMLFGIHLHMLKDYSGALKQYNDALTVSPNNIEIHYNIALTYIETGEFDKAYEHAQIAYKAGYPLPGLKDILKRHGYYANNTKP